MTFLSGEINFDRLDFNRVARNNSQFSFQSNVNIEYNGRTYEDLLVIDWRDNAGRLFRTTLGGYDLNVDAQGLLTGRLTGILEERSTNGVFEAYLGFADFDISADIVSRAAFTAESTDDLTAIRTILAGADSIDGSSKADRIRSFDGDDTIRAGAGNDVVLGGGGNDVIAGGLGDDRLVGESGNDTFEFNVLTDGSDSMDGGAGFDRVLVSNASSSGPRFGQIRLTFVGSEVGDGRSVDSNTHRLNDVNKDYAANQDGGLAVRLQVEDGFDRRVGLSSRIDDEGVEFIGGVGVTFDVRDLLLGNRRGDQFSRVVLGTQAGDRFVGSLVNDYINGGMGNDTLSGGEGSDFLAGGEGNDSLLGGDGNDFLRGNSGNDSVYGQAGDDAITVARFDEKLDVDDSDLLDGGAGFDTLTITVAGYKPVSNDRLVGIESVIVRGSRVSDFSNTPVSANVDLSTQTEAFSVQTFGAFDTVTGGTGNDLITVNGGGIISGSGGNDTITAVSFLYTTIDGGDGSDSLLGGGGHDSISGGAGNDSVSGGFGRDTLNGGDGIDTLTGGSGSDLLTGGAGRDRFVYLSLLDLQSSSQSGPQADVEIITDFRLAQGDRIDLSLIDADPFIEGNQAFTWIGTSDFTGEVNGQLRFSEGIVSGDIDGDQFADFEIQLSGVSTLTADAFIL